MSNELIEPSGDKTPTRRALLTGLAGAAVAAPLVTALPAIAKANPDAELFRLIREREKSIAVNNAADDDCTRRLSAAHAEYRADTRAPGYWKDPNRIDLSARRDMHGVPEYPSAKSRSYMPMHGLWTSPDYSSRRAILRTTRGTDLPQPLAEKGAGTVAELISSLIS